MRRKIVAGNWKMNKTPSEAVGLINELIPLEIRRCGCCFLRTIRCFTNSLRIS